MSYNKRPWANGDLITKERMNNIENGIYDAHDKINTINNKAEENTTNTNTARKDISDIKLQIGTEELTTTSKKIKGSINELSSQIKENKKKIEKRINIYEYESLVVNEDWSVAINTAIQENPNSEIFIPGGDFKCKSTINFSGLCKIVGVKGQTNLLLMTENTTLINMNPTSSNQNHATFENINLKGLGRDKNQKGIDFQAWNSGLKDCIISDFKIGIDVKGVLLNIEDCYVVGNEIGIAINQFEDGVPSTMINIKKVLLHYNSIAIYADDENDPNNKRPCIGLYVDNSAFEWNDYAFKIKSIMYTSFKNCWFEQNANRPETCAINLILENNRYEVSGGKDQTIKFIPSETGETGVYGGYNEADPGYFKTKILELEEYNSSDITATCNKQLKIKDENLVVDNDKIVITPEYQIHYSIILDKNGIIRTDLPKNTITFTKNGTGDYTLKFINRKNLYRPVITTTFVNDDGGSEIIGTTRLRFVDLATYLDWFSVDEIQLNSYNKTTNNPCESKIMISIWCDGIPTKH